MWSCCPFICWQSNVLEACRQDAELTLKVRPLFVSYGPFGKSCLSCYLHPQSPPQYLLPSVLTGANIDSQSLFRTSFRLPLSFLCSERGCFSVTIEFVFIIGLGIEARSLWRIPLRILGPGWRLLFNRRCMKVFGMMLAANEEAFLNWLEEWAFALLMT